MTIESASKTWSLQNLQMGSGEPTIERVFPSKESTLPFWRTELHELDTYRSTPDLPHSCDILIIGGGYAGITSAYHLLNGLEGKDRKLNIVLVEARQACSGATARNGWPTSTNLDLQSVNYTRRPSSSGCISSSTRLYETL
jgi:lysine/ornithine N-monooxygenase